MTSRIAQAEFQQDSHHEVFQYSIQDKTIQNSAKPKSNEIKRVVNLPSDTHKQLLLRGGKGLSKLSF